MFDLKSLAGYMKTTTGRNTLKYKKGVFEYYQKELKLDGEKSVRKVIRKNVIPAALNALVSTKNKKSFADFWAFHFENEIDFALIPNSDKKESYAQLIKKAAKIFNEKEKTETPKKTKKEKKTETPEKTETPDKK